MPADTFFGFSFLRFDDITMHLLPLVNSAIEIFRNPTGKGSVAFSLLLLHSSAYEYCKLPLVDHLPFGPKFDLYHETGPEPSFC